MQVRSLSGANISGTHKLEGIGAGFIPSVCRLDLADEIMAVSDEDAYNIARNWPARKAYSEGQPAAQMYGRDPESQEERCR